ncbi:MAG: hypothetical protein HDS52_05655 [Barnesiella sp.]|nr:hypothetical protein [Barnesiella sp.]
MTNEISEWNGYPVYGDVRELDYIAGADSLINLEKDDIIRVLSADGKNYLTTSIHTNLGDAFKDALNDLSCNIDNVNSLLIDFRYGNKSPKMSELSPITASLSEANPDIDVVWGMSSDETLADSCKVTLLASVKA